MPKNKKNIIQVNYLNDFFQITIEIVSNQNIVIN